MVTPTNVETPEILTLSSSALPLTSRSPVSVVIPTRLTSPRTSSGDDGIRLPIPTFDVVERFPALIIHPSTAIA